MGWKNLPHIFCTATETVADLANAALHYNTPALLNSMDDMAEAIFREETPKLHPALSGLTRDPYLRWFNAKTAAYVDVYFEIFRFIPGTHPTQAPSMANLVPLPGKGVLAL